MTLRKLLKIVVGLLLLFAMAVGLTSINHPIILKWLTGSARIIGKPTNAIVYTNGHATNDIKVYKVGRYWDDGPNTPKKAHTYLLSLKNFDNEGKLPFININLDQVWAGRPVGASKNDYDYIMGYLLQSDVGGHFANFTDDMKGYGFDPHLSFNDKQIKFNVPPNKLKFDSVRIELQ
jgi:hypothetical protein